MALGVRSYGNSLLMQNVFKPDALSHRVPALKAFGDKILHPVFKCVEEDCATSIGRVVPIPEFDAVGLIDLATDQIITKEMVTNWITNGIFIARVRDSSTCLSSGGFCAKCGNGFFAREGDSRVAVGSSYTLEGTPRSYQNFIAGTYGGALLGFSKLASDPIPAPYRNWSTITSHEEMDGMCDLLDNMGANSDEVDYLRTVEDILERALSIIGVYGVYGYV